MKVITLNREYGAGGHSIGVQTAEKLGIPFYDKDIIKNAAIEGGIDPDVLKADESIKTGENFIKMISPVSYDQKQMIFEVEREVILKLVAEGPCVILGRCANFIMREAGIESLDVFLYADDIHRAMRVSQLINSTDAGTIQKEMKKTDTMRRNYYYRFAGKNWRDPENYNLCLDTGMLGYDKCIELICSAAKD